MMSLCRVLFLLFAVVVFDVYASICKQDNILMVGRVVYGESRGEPAIGQKAVAYTIVNRMNHAGYPNTLRDVVYQKAANNHHQYETLDLPGHDSAWTQAKTRKNAEFLNAVNSAARALCFGKDDPTNCATDFCNKDPCASTDSNQYWETFNKTKIGGHYFVCRRPTTAG